jgi:hypothetical protein
MVDAIVGIGYEFMPVVFLYVAPAFLLPIIIGPIILRSSRDELGKLAAWFTLKPLPATVLWVTALVWLANGLKLDKAVAEVLSLIPSVAITGVIAWRFRDLIRTDASVLAAFLGGDVLRWLNTLAWMRHGGQLPLLDDPFYVLGLGLPNACAVLAFALIRRRPRERRMVQADGAVGGQSHA